ncbi:hypothetical protein T484DRAFT_1892276, partial [Baffinella frigidus]
MPRPGFDALERASADPASGRPALLVLTVELGGGISGTITVRDGDDPRSLAHDFASRWGLDPAQVVAPLAAHIQQERASVATSALGSPGDDGEEAAYGSGDASSTGGPGSPLGWEAAAARSDHPAPACPPRASSGQAQTWISQLDARDAQQREQSRDQQKERQRLQQHEEQREQRDAPSRVGHGPDAPHYTEQGVSSSGTLSRAGTEQHAARTDRWSSSPLSVGSPKMVNAELQREN